MTDPLADEILGFWFGQALESSEQAAERSKVWFRRDPQFDAEIARRFGELPQLAGAGGLDHWSGSAQSALARIIVLDQFPRNLYRDDPRAFAFDAIAAAGSVATIADGFDMLLHPLQCVFLYLPLEHAEDLDMQRRSVSLFERLAARAPDGCSAQFEGFVDYARRHRDVIARFGRFPHRNAALARQSTQEELDYLVSGGEQFGARRA